MSTVNIYFGEKGKISIVFFWKESALSESMIKPSVNQTRLSQNCFGSKGI